MPSVCDTDSLPLMMVQVRKAHCACSAGVILSRSPKVPSTGIFATRSMSAAVRRRSSQISFTTRKPQTRNIAASAAAKPNTALEERTLFDDAIGGRLAEHFVVTERAVLERFCFAHFGRERLGHVFQNLIAILDHGVVHTFIGQTEQFLR